MNIDLLKENLVRELCNEGIALPPPIDRILAEEIYRSSQTNPIVQRGYFLPVTSALSDNKLVARVERVFAITPPTCNHRTLCNIEEIRRISDIGYSLRNGCLLRIHHQSCSSTPSVSYLIEFMATDMALGMSLNHLLVSGMGDSVLVKRFNFKHCYDCAHFRKFLKGGPLKDSMVDREVDTS